MAHYNAMHLTLFFASSKFMNVFFIKNDLALNVRFSMHGLLHSNLLQNLCKLRILFLCKIMVKQKVAMQNFPCKSYLVFETTTPFLFCNPIFQNSHMQILNSFNSRIKSSWLHPSCYRRPPRDDSSHVPSCRKWW